METSTQGDTEISSAASELLNTRQKYAGESLVSLFKHSLNTQRRWGQKTTTAQAACTVW